MKKQLIILLALLVCGAATAKPVGLDKARLVAENFLKGQGVERVELKDLTGESPFQAFYTFSLGERGFVLVASDDAVEPILGYSISNAFNPKEIPDHVRGWLEEYEELVEQNQGGGAHPSWASLLEGGQPAGPKYTPVSPMLSTSWDQSPWYNNLCPGSGYQKAVTGCVATATAQIMKYYNYPATGYGSHSYSCDYGTLSADFGATTYQWSQMPNYLSNGSTSAQVNAVATLMYHVGVADEMDYGADASGAHNYSTDGSYRVASSQNSLIEYFKYAPDMKIVDRERHSNSAFCALLRADIDQGHPVLYSGRAPEGGHSFVLDGYDAQGRFHVNWGWGGYYDGYFHIGALNPTGGGTGSAGSNQYNLSNVALTNIHPNDDWAEGASTRITISSAGNGTVAGGGNYPFGYQAMLSATASSGYRFSQWEGGGSFSNISFTTTGGEYNYVAYFESILQNDTVSYCGPGRNSSSYGNSNGTTTWGMRIPEGVLNRHSLKGVQLYLNNPGSYTLSVYEGTTAPDRNNPLCTTTVNLTGSGWKTIALSAPVEIDPGKSLWIAFTSSASYPAAVTPFCGNMHGTLWGSSLNPGNINGTFMIRALVEEREIREHTIVVESNNEAWGTVSGGGTYEEGTYATLTATPKAGCGFVEWQDGSTANPRTVYVMADETYTATFAPRQGIGEAEDEVLSQECYDLLGRRLQAEPARGLYLIRTVTTRGVGVRKVVRR